MDAILEPGWLKRVSQDVKEEIRRWPSNSSFPAVRDAEGASCSSAPSSSERADDKNSE
jgi:hypothetical protein